MQNRSTMPTRAASANTVSHRTRARTRRFAVAGVTAGALLLAGCTATGAATTPPPAGQTATSAADEILAPYGMSGQDARQVIDQLEALGLDERPAELRASIRPDELLLADADGHEASLPMPADAFYVSIAPYVETTHECGYHSLTTCTGELGGQTMHVVVTDTASGDVIVDDDLTAAPNGFVGLWVPRDADLNVSVEAQGRTATADLSTASPEDLTCITTMQLV